MSLRHDRRRRMLADDGLSHASTDELEQAVRAGGAHSGASGQRAYAEDVYRVLDRPVREFFPTRLLGICLLACGGLVLVAALAAGHVWSTRLDDRWTGTHVGLLDLAAAGNASGWLAAVLLALAGVASLYIYALRRHRVDDYHGRYRVWLWTALACLAVSFGEASNFAAVLRTLCHWAATASNVDPSIAWPMIVAGALLVMGLRVLLEVWRCRSAVALFSLMATGILVATASFHGWIAQVPAEHQRLLIRGSWLAAYILLLAALLTYARYVVLEIEGKVAVKVAKPKPPKAKKAKKVARRQDAESKPEPRKAVRTDLEPAPAVAATLKLSSGDSDTRQSSRTESRIDRDDEPQRALTRKERRRLRRAA